MLLNEDQILLRDTVRSALEGTITPEYRTSKASPLLPIDTQVLSLLDSIALSESFIGPDAPYTLAELGVVASEFGRVLLPVPILEHLTCNLVANHPSLKGDSYLAQAYPLFGTGVTVASPAVCSVEARSVEVAEKESAWEASGTVSALATLSAPTSVIVWQKAAPDANEPGAYLVPRDNASNSITSTRATSIDLLTPLESLTLSSARAYPLGKNASTLLLAALRVMVANECSGISQYVIEKSCEYVKTREQYGVPVGGFQALQHTIANSAVETESLRALASFAAWCLAASPEQVPLTSRTALARAITVAPAVCERAIQVHGGIGFTWEFELHHYLRRAKARSIQWGGTADNASTVSLADQILAVA